MSEFPKRIWAYSPNNSDGIWGWDEMGFAAHAPGNEYTRKDVADAMLKAEREKALRDAVDAIGGLIEPDNKDAALQRLRALISKDKTDGN